MSREQDRPLGAPELPGRSGWDLLAIVAVVTGTVLRARHFFAGQSLWLDEAMLALNILSRSCGGLFEPLDYSQAAPPIYLCMTRAVALPFGGSELGLRLPSLIAGLLAMVLVWRVGRALVGPEVAAWATWLLAISPLAIYYSNEVKPYMLDAMVAILLVGLAWRVLASPREGRRSGWLGGVGLLALLTSFTAPFVLGGVGTLLMIDGAVRRDRPAMTRAFALGSLWLVSFVIIYTSLYRGAGNSAFLAGYWASYFLTLGAEWRAELVNAITSVTSGLPIPEALVRARYLVPAGVLATVITTRVAGWRVASLLISPFVIVFLAAMLRRYPLDPRLVLFVAPAAALLAATGLVGGLRVARVASARARGVAIGLAVCIAGLLVWNDPPPGPGGRRTARAAAQHADAAAGLEFVFLTRLSTPTWVYYTTDWEAPDWDRLDWFRSQFRNLSATPGPGEDTLTPARIVVRTVVTPGGARREGLATPSGLGYRPGGRSQEVYPDWARSQVVQLAAFQAGGIWVPGARPQESVALREAWIQAGGTATVHEVAEAADVLELRRRLAEW